MSKMNLEEIIKQDLGKYDQDHLYPKSLTIVNDEYFRHYELGSIVGFVVYYEGASFIIAELHEDDDFWFTSNHHGIYMDAFWTRHVCDTLNRMNNWINEHLSIGPSDNGWQNKVIKPIEAEEIQW